MYIDEIRAMSDDELLDALEDKKASLFVFRRDRVTGELKDANTIHYAKRDIARLKTVQRERELAVQMTAEEPKNGE